MSLWNFHFEIMQICFKLGKENFQGQNKTLQNCVFGFALKSDLIVKLEQC